jgi:hypothetical protein
MNVNGYVYKPRKYHWTPPPPASSLSQANGETQNVLWGGSVASENFKIVQVQQFGTLRRRTCFRS